MAAAQRSPAHSKTRSLPALLLHAEGILGFIAAVAAYVYTGGSGVLFVALLLAPDLAMIGYTRNPQIGAWVYNTAHTYLLPGLLLMVAVAGGWLFGVQIALIWLAHISMDRAGGYGLKYATHFKDSHLQRV